MLHPQVTTDTNQHHQHGYYVNESRPLSDAQVILKNKDLWTQFHELQTEMIITKSGRRMFPSMHIDLTNLEPQAHYCVFLELDLAVKCRFKYSSSVGWSPAGHEEAQSAQRVYMHPESPNTGENWMAQTVSFGRVKLTNTCAPPPGHVVLSSMHKYQPKVVIVKSTNPASFGWAPTKSVAFPETQFVAVTAYQNERITKLKIDHNPFAKGFRENGKSSAKRKQSKEEDVDVLSSDGDQSPRKAPAKPTRPEKNNNCGGGDVVEIVSNVPPVHHLHYEYCFATYPLYNALWTAAAPLPLYFQHPPVREGGGPPFFNRIEGEGEVKPRKLTDFSIRAITGHS